MTDTMRGYEAKRIIESAMQPYLLNLTPPEGKEFGWVRHSLQTFKENVRPLSDISISINGLQKAELIPDDENLERAKSEGWEVINSDNCTMNMTFSPEDIKKLQANPGISFKDNMIQCKEAVLCIRDKREQKVEEHVLTPGASDGWGGYGTYGSLQDAEDSINIVFKKDELDENEDIITRTIKRPLYKASELALEMPEVDEMLAPVMEEMERIKFATREEIENEERKKEHTGISYMGSLENGQ